MVGGFDGAGFAGVRKQPYRTDRFLYRVVGNKKDICC